MFAYLRLLRPRQMTKNVFCFAGLIFSGRFLEPGAVPGACLAFASFCLISSAVYILNDCIDRDRDRVHVRKRNRPIASGAVNIPAAICLATILTAGAVVLAYLASIGTLVCLLLYMLNNLAYSLILKHKALVDVISIAIGFVLRLLAGVYAVDDLPTSWITLCTFFLTVFLGLCKRRAELAGIVPESENEQRPVLSQYTLQFLDYLVNSSAVMTVMCYALFTTTGNKDPSLVITVPIVFFAVLHYKRIVMLLSDGEEPERLVLRDYRLQASIAIWFALYLAIALGNWRLFR
jgi:4-hydroxybenzoate polyprenyltransferase